MVKTERPPRGPGPLTLAIPKGRILKQLAPHFAALGVDAQALVADDRRLVRDEGGLRFLLLKPDDVPTYVEHGAADLGVVGRDVLFERDVDLLEPLDLGIGRCRLVVAGLAGTQLLRERYLRVATKFPAVAERHFATKGILAQTIFVQGSVEIAPVVGLADVIVDLVESGETLRQNGLVELETIAEVSSVVVVNRLASKLRSAEVARVLAALAACPAGSP